MALWNGKLTAIVLTAAEPMEAREYWAELLGGRADGDSVELGGGTRIVIREGSREGLAELRLDAGLELMTAAQHLGGDAQNGPLQLRDPDGWLLQLRGVEAVEPLTLGRVTLSHVTLNSPDPLRQSRFYGDLLFLLSDALGELFFWMRLNPIHHSMAFAKHPAANINHLAVELPTRHDFISAIDRVTAHGLKLEFGPGRHLVGGNLFAYFVDRYGLRWELCAEMARLDPQHEPGRLTAEDRARSVNTFGPPPPTSFINEPGGPPPV
ncbi:MAG: VOC family protein [Solirubrobacterales bacterium]|nr:VOC family protein [Solirubrobacterales bacterium]